MYEQRTQVSVKKIFYNTMNSQKLSIILFMQVDRPIPAILNRNRESL